MITSKQRRICRLMVKLKLWNPRECMWTVDFDPCWGTRWLHRRIRKTQPVDDLHHAPACLANHYHRARIVYGRCNCGAQTMADLEPSDGELPLLNKQPSDAEP